jgi:THO complex subunit 3
MATGSADALVSLWDLSEMLCINTFCELEWPVRTISFTHDGLFIASASEDKFVDIVSQMNIYVYRYVY